MDARPPEDLLEQTPDVRYVVPAIVWNQWATEGNLRPPGKLYSLDFGTEMKDVLTATLHRSGLMTPAGGEQLRLKLTIRHLYGITHASTVSIATIGGASESQRTFAPYGYAAAELEISGRAGIVATRKVIGWFDPNLNDVVAESFPTSVDFTDRLTAAAVHATGHLASNVVRALEPVLAAYPRPKPIDVERVSTFFVARAVQEGAFLEVVGVAVDSGEIVSSTIVPRWMEPYAAVDEWVVDPYFGGQMRLTPDEYDRLVLRLQQRYDVRYVTDVRTAHFFGKKKGAGTEAPATLHVQR